MLVDQVSHVMYVSRVTVTDYVPNPNAVDDLMDKLAPTLQKVGDKVSEGFRAMMEKAPSRRSMSQRG